MLETIGTASLLFVTFALISCVSVSSGKRHLMIVAFNVVFAAWVFRTGCLIFFFVPLANFALFRLWSRRSSSKRGWLLGLGLTVSAAPLILLRWPREFDGRSLFLPISLCFFSLQQLGAWAELHFGRLDLPRSLSLWFCYSTYFPSIFAGPISRWNEMKSQFEQPRRFDRAGGWRAASLFLQAIFKVTVFAIPLQELTNRYFNQPMSYGPVATLVAALLFRYYLWAEISAQTDWARAASAMLGIELPENFLRPFQQQTLGDFWRRWHMTLSFWLRDYIFFPLAMGPLRRKVFAPLVIPLSLLVTFAVFGLWHGLTFALLVMGAWKGLGVIVTEKPLRWLKESRSFFVKNILGRLSFFFAFVLFVGLPSLLLKIEGSRAVDLLRMNLTALTDGDHRWRASLSDLFETFTGGAGSREKLFVWFGAVLIWQLLEAFDRRRETESAASAVGSSWPTVVRTAMILLLFALWVLVGGFSSEFRFSYSN